MSARIKIRLSFFIGISFLFFSSPLKVFAQEPIVQELIPGFDYVQFFQTNNDFGFTPQTIDPNNQGNVFGAYVIEPVGDRLYIGFSAGSPGNYDGALLAVYENGALTPLRLCMDEACTNIKRGLTEQGLHDMTFVNGVLYVAGTDPCCSDDWTYGNIYTYIPGQNIVKHRNLPNVLHTLGLWVDPSNNNIYAATGAHTGDSKTWTALLFRSHDGASSWENPVNVYNDISSTGKVLRVTDIIGFNNKLYAIRASNSSLAGLVEATEYGQAWKIPPNLAVYTNLKPRLLLYQDSLLFLGSGGHIIWSLNKEGKESRFILPGIKLRGDVWNAFSNENDNFLYAVSDSGLVVRSNDLVSWYEVAKLGKPQDTIVYWPNKNKLVFSESRPQVKIQTLDLSQITSPTIIPAPTDSPPLYYISFGPRGTPHSSWNSAEELLEVLNQSGFTVNDIYRLVNGAVDTHIYRLPFNNFEIKAGEGYLLGFKNSLPVNFDPQLTYDVIENFTYRFSPGNTFISFPQKVIEDNPILQDAKSALEDMNKNETNVTKMMYWNDQTQTYVDYEPGNPFSQNFPLESGKGYLVSSNKSFTWELNGTRDLSPAPCTPLEALGDLDCSGKIDVADLSILLASFGKKEGESGFDPKADLDSSKKINMADLSILFNNLGKNK